MTVSLMQLRRRVRQRLGIPQTDQFMLDDVIDDHINLALDTVSSEHNWPWDEKLVDIDAADGVVALPEDWRTTRAVWCGNILLANVSPTDPQNEWSTGTDSQPSQWAEVSNSIRLLPPVTGTTTIKLDYYSKARPMIEDDDQLAPMPEQYAGAIIAKAAELLSLREDNAGAVERHAAEYASWLARMRRALRRSTGPIVPRVREGSWV